MAELNSGDSPAVLLLHRHAEGLARHIAQAVGGQVHALGACVDDAVEFDDVGEHLRELFAARKPIIGICASGILIRHLAPMLSDKTVEPPVLAVSADGMSVVPLLGGHRGANALAHQLSEAIGAFPALTTASDVVHGVALDDPPAGWRVGDMGRAKPVAAAILSGAEIAVSGEGDWPDELEAKLQAVRIPAAPSPMAARPDDFAFIGVGEGAQTQMLGYHATRYALGLGCARGCSAREMRELVEQTLAEHGINRHAIAGVFSIDLKADEAAILATAEWLGVPARFFTAGELEAQADRLATPSEVVFAEVGCHGVSEGAALAAAGEAAELVVPKCKTGNATLALARAPEPLTALKGRARGKLSVIGIGPGQAEWRTPQASRLIAEADELVGYGLYIDLLGPLAAGKARKDFPLGGEEDRCRYALEEAGKGRNVALICSGDAGIYAMGALVMELLHRGDGKGGISDPARRVEVVNAPGITALQAASARVGALIGHDFCAVSLSDLLTPREDILRRLKAAAEGDFVMALYNPVSKRRRELLDEARRILLEHRPPETPVLLASNLGRIEERLTHRTLETLKTDEVDMLTVVLIGSSQSRSFQGGDGITRVFTPRGYAKKLEDR